MATITRQVIGHVTRVVARKGGGSLVTIQGSGDWADWSETFPVYKGVVLAPLPGYVGDETDPDWGDDRAWSVGARGQLVASHFVF
jgi:hypothetical protein